MIMFVYMLQGPGVCDRYILSLFYFLDVHLVQSNRTPDIRISFLLKGSACFVHNAARKAIADVRRMRRTPLGLSFEK